MFSGFGKMTRFEHKPRVDPNVPAVLQGLRRLPFSVREEVSSELKRLQDEEIIEPVDASSWISNLVVEIRLCVNLKAVNKAIIPDKHPLPTIDELSVECHDSMYFTKLEVTCKFQWQRTAITSQHL